MKKLLEDKVPRYERKYLIQANQLEQIRFRLEPLCFRDKNAGADGRYNIRSLYFDDYCGSSYRDNEIGNDPRSKFRIRIYNCDDCLISLEQKTKVSDKIYKKRAMITKAFLEAIISDEAERIDYPDKEPLINEFMTAYHTRYLRPSVIVDYSREPYVYPEGDVRITFDTNIAFSSDFDNFFDRKLFLQPILPVGIQLLEVKYTGFLPEFIHQQLNVMNLQQSTFSKYYLCEKNKRIGE